MIFLSNYRSSLKNLIPSRLNYDGGICVSLWAARASCYLLAVPHAVQLHMLLHGYLMVMNI